MTATRMTKACEGYRSQNEGAEMSINAKRQIATYEKVSGTDVQSLINDHIGLVRKIAWQVNAKIGSAIELEDLVQIGLVALIESAQTYEDRGVPFGHYAKIRVKGALIDSARKIALASRTTLSKRKQYLDAKTKLEATYGRAPSDAEMSEASGLQPATIRHLEVELSGWRTSSLEDAYTDRSMAFAATELGQDAEYDRSETERRLAEVIASLPEREAMILHLIFFEDMNLEEIGQTLNVTAARVCQIKKAALGKIRERLGDIDIFSD